MRGLLIVLCCVLSSLAVADDLQSVLDRHLRTDAALWAQEPRLLALLRDPERNNAALDEAGVAALLARWRAEMTGDGGELTDRVASRFVSNYLAEVALRLDGAYGPLLLLDNRGLVVAASELPDEAGFADEPCVRRLAEHPGVPWVQDRRPATGHYTRIALPVADDDGVRLGTLLFDIDVSRLPEGSLAGSDTRRRDDTAVSVHEALPASAVVR